MHDVGLLAPQQPHQPHERSRIARAGLPSDEVHRSAGRRDLLGDWATATERDDARLNASPVQAGRRAEDQLLGAAHAQILADQQRLHRVDVLTAAPPPGVAGLPRRLPLRSGRRCARRHARRSVCTARAPTRAARASVARAAGSARRRESVSAKVGMIADVDRAADRLELVEVRHGVEVDGDDRAVEHHRQQHRR